MLQVGLKSLSYEMQEQQPAYDTTSMLGEIVFAAERIQSDQL